jgi:hypothetical protein
MLRQLIDATASCAPVTRSSRMKRSKPPRHLLEQEPSRNRAAANDYQVLIPTRLKEVPPKQHTDRECPRESDPEHHENKSGQQNAG